MIEFRILGPLEALENDRALALGGPKVRALLAVLLLHRGEVVSSDRLIDALWGERASDGSVGKPGIRIPPGCCRPSSRAAPSTPPSMTRATSARLADAGRLTGPQRYVAYGKLDLELARNAAPLVVYGDPTSSDFFSARIGCQTYGSPYGIDLAALCIKHGGH